MTPSSYRPLSKIVVSLANQPKLSNLFTHFDVSADYLTARLPILGSMVAIRVATLPNGNYMIGSVGLNPVAARWLHDVLVVSSHLTFTKDGKEIQLMAGDVGFNSIESTIVECARVLFDLREQEESGDFPAAESVSMYWSSGVLNFGDWAGPHIVQALTGKQPVQSNRPGSGTRVLYSVGSILGWFKRNNVDIWGSGLMRPLTEAEILERSKLSGIKVHAVRGRKTKECLERDLGWDVPDIFGDPALLLPDFIEPAQFKYGQVACVPHNIHRAKVNSGNPAVRVVDARQDVRDVVQEITGASAVISSSLHGLIVAQAYQIPWVWLEVTDQPLGGGDFKFEDFFSCLDRSSVAHVQVSKDSLHNLDFDQIASMATVPELNIDLQLLRDALPVRTASQPVRRSGGLAVA